MKRYKLKEPIIMLDEPEISLHIGKFSTFKKHVSDEMNRSSLRICLKADFRELYNVLDKIGKMVTPE